MKLYTWLCNALSKCLESVTGTARNVQRNTFGVGELTWEKGVAHLSDVQMCFGLDFLGRKTRPAFVAYHQENYAIREQKKKSGGGG
jgi:hypothetical protein